MKPAAIALTLALLILAPVPAAAADADLMTKRELLFGLAASAGFDIDAGRPLATREALAAAALERIGIRLPGRPDDPVRERDLVSVGSAVGATVVSGKPDDKVSEKKGNVFALDLKPAMLRARARMEEIRVSCQGRLSRAGRKGTPASPANPNATAPPCP